jgi:hypothetical protein
MKQDCTETKGTTETGKPHKIMYRDFPFLCLLLLPCQNTLREPPSTVDFDKIKTIFISLILIHQGKRE